MDIEVGVSREALHAVLWSRRTAGDLVEIRQKELAEQLGVVVSRAGHVLRRMQKEGRLLRVPGSQGPYRVIDPATFAP